MIPEKIREEALELLAPIWPIKDNKILPAGSEILFAAIKGSHAHGTNIEGSDIDIVGVYRVDAQSKVVGDYNPQTDIDKDTTFYEYSRFLHLLKSANPTMLEILFSPKDAILYIHPDFEDTLESKDKFLTQKCKHSFGGYAYAQIKKARGLDKKMNYEKHFTEEKTILDFCYVLDSSKRFMAVPFQEYIKSGPEHLDPKFMGAVRLDHTKGIYTVYYDWQAHYNGEGIRPNADVKPLGFKGIANQFIVLPSSVPKYMEPEFVMFWNLDAWNEYNKKHGEYKEWLENRNVQRYVDVENHGQKIDGKNLLHAVRLINIAKEIGDNKGLTVKRPEAKDLIAIRRGEVKLDDILEKAEKDVELMNAYFDKNDKLPWGVEDGLLKNLILGIYGK